MADASGKPMNSNGEQMALDIENGETQPDGTQPKHENNSKGKQRKGIINRALHHIEELYIFSLLYMQKSPLQPLIGPGATLRTEDHFFAHACYMVVWLFLPIAYFIINIQSIRSYVVRDVNLCNFVHDTTTCECIVVILFVNRFCFAVGSFYLLMACMQSVACKRSEYIRPSLQNGFWIPKLMLIFIVSLITSSLPPGIFDTLWHYILLFSTIPQNTLAVYFILDLARDVSNSIETSKAKYVTYIKNCLFCYGPIAIVCGFSLGMLIYCIVNSFKHEALSRFDLCFLVAQLAIVVVVAIASMIKVRSFVQLALITAFVTWRISLSLQYNVALHKHRSYLDVFTTIDFVIKLLLLFYGLFRKRRLWHYSFASSVMYGCDTSGMTSQSGCSIKKNNQSKSKHQEKALGDLNKVKKCSNEEEKQNKGEIEFENDVFKISSMEKDLDNRYCELKMTKEQQLNEIGKRSTNLDKVDEDEEKVAVYNYHFVHVILGLFLCDLNLNFAKFRLITEFNSRYQLRRNLSTSVILGLISIFVSVLYMWCEVVCRTDWRITNLSATKQLLHLLKSLKNLFVATMIEAPPLARKSQNIKYIYAGILTLFFAAACAVVNPSVKSWLSEYSLFCDMHSKQGQCLSPNPSLVALFRISISASLTFMLLGLIMIRLQNPSDFRNRIQTGLWPSKILMCGLIFAVSLNLSIQVGNVWIYISLAATLLIIMLQTVFVLDATSQVLNCIRDTEHPNTSRKISFSCSSITVLLYTTAITAFFCFYVYFAQFSSCRANRLFIFINLGLCITACVISLHPVVQEGGLVQSAIITSFCMYCTWSALYNNPREECNPLATEMLETNLKPTKSVIFALDFAAFIATFVYVTVNISRIQAFFERFMFICCKFKNLRSDIYRKAQEETFALSTLSFQKALLGKTLENVEKVQQENVGKIRNGKNKAQEIEENKDPTGERDSNISLETPTKEKRLQLSGKQQNEESEENNKKENQFDNPSDTSREDDGKIPYNYSLLHFIYSLFMLYFSLLLITWIDERPGSRMKVNIHWAIMCIRMMASCCSVLVYMWNLVGHLILYSLHQKSHVSCSQ
eukprot:gene20606-22639_t